MILAGLAVGGKSPCRLSITHAAPYRLSRFDRGPVRVDYFCYECSCGETIASTTPRQAATALRGHLHNAINWAAMDR